MIKYYKCKECDGIGLRENYQICKECHGTGWIIIEEVMNDGKKR